MAGDVPHLFNRGKAGLRLFNAPPGGNRGLLPIGDRSPDGFPPVARKDCSTNRD